ncbi:hypothetical protein M406DRAFT_249884 [Cryphonectria parasitica EP155]|uniref:Uncharacterized protein n=1 Tax=Cryphonectria parasitica (strain ATCC 38755 / EP155) TaxID=660469 RepID=A0A9P5CSF6_CRYP1|nr:uncharacterized protein M406DRAFT_249884 [Cryphonectria parasitica EP155]KAF3768276.1 hypothetical protein M406DRAFT_249884 [Cryphonectria parasitica EP155]
MHDLAFLIEILNRINKSRICKPSSVPKSIQDRDLLVSRLLENFIEMPVCSYCEDCSFEFCKVFPGDSSRCIECIRLGCSKCNVISSSPEKLRNIAIQHRKLENEIEKRKIELLCLR